jgi:hypothetical protein
MPDKNSPRVFVTYSHDTPEHKDLVRQFCTFLRRDTGVDIHLDQWYDDGGRDWSAWAIEQMTHADFILAIASPAYKQRAEGLAAADEGRGSQFEAAMIRDDLTRDLPGETRRILSVVLPGRSIEEIPKFMRPYSTTHFIIPEFTHHGVESLLAAFSQVARYPPPARGTFAGNPFAKLHAQLQVEEQAAEQARNAPPTGRAALLTEELRCSRHTQDISFRPAEIDGDHYGSSVVFRSSLYCAEPKGIAEFTLGRKYVAFKAVAGVLDDAVEATQVGYFQVIIDDIAQPQLRATYGNPVRFTVNVTGVLRLRLVAYRPDTVGSPLMSGVLAAGGKSSRLPELAWGNPTLTQ